MSLGIRFTLDLAWTARAHQHTSLWSDHPKRWLYIFEPRLPSISKKINSKLSDYYGVQKTLFFFLNLLNFRWYHFIIDRNKYDVLENESTHLRPLCLSCLFTLMPRGIPVFSPRYGYSWVVVPIQHTLPCEVVVCSIPAFSKIWDLYLVFFLL